MKRLIRAIGIGIFLSGAFVFFYGQAKQVESITHSGLKPGYELIKKDELNQLKSDLRGTKDELASIQLSLNNSQSNKPEEKPKSEKQQENSNSKFLLSIERGANPVSISNDLKKAGIISNERDFVNYLEDHNLSSKIQVGQYTLTSGMTLSEIADVITK